MTAQDRNGDVSSELTLLLKTLEAEERARIEALFETALNAARHRKVSDLWERIELASTFWILLVSGVNAEEEMKIAETVLKWKAFFTKDSTAITCIQSSEREAFRCCSTAFEVRGCPTLLLGNSIEMSDYIRFDPQFLLKLLQQKDGLQRFLTSVQGIIENGGTLNTITTQLRDERFWADLQLSLLEIKESIKFSADKCKFDIFLSHNSRDKPAVRRLAKTLKERNIKVWMDEAQLIPGRPWQDGLEKIISSVPVAAVIVGKDGIGPWENPEMRGCLMEFVERRMAVIPVLLPGVNQVPELPLFLRQFTWVDLRKGLTRNGIDLLVCGIMGRTPENVLS